MPRIADDPSHANFFIPNNKTPNDKTPHSVRISTQSLRGHKVTDQLIMGEKKNDPISKLRHSIGQQRTTESQTKFNAVKSEDKKIVKQLIAFFNRLFGSSSQSRKELNIPAQMPSNIRANQKMNNLHDKIMEFSDEILSAQDEEIFAKQSEFEARLEELKSDLDTAKTQLKSPSSDREIKILNNQIEEVEERLGLRKPTNKLEETEKMFKKELYAKPLKEEYSPVKEKKSGDLHIQRPKDTEKLLFGEKSEVHVGKEKRIASQQQRMSKSYMKNLNKEEPGTIKKQTMNDLHHKIMEFSDEIISAQDKEISDHKNEFKAVLEELKSELDKAKMNIKPPPTDIEIKILKNQIEEIEERLGIREVTDQFKETEKMFKNRNKKI